jgi:peptidoglycan hydrolase CwlO-like protein
MDRDQLKELIRTEPTIAATFASVDDNYQRVVANAEALGKRRDELRSQLDAIEAAKAELAKQSAAPPATVTTEDPPVAEPEPDVEAAVEPSDTSESTEPKPRRTRRAKSAEPNDQ